MSSKQSIGRAFILRADHDSDIISFLTKFAKENKIRVATFALIGALKWAKLGFYDQQKHEYCEMRLSAPQEIASCIGNISLKEGEPFVHAHAVVADEHGNTRGGHLLGGTVFAAEIHLIELVGPRLVRVKDDVTGLSLWKL